MRGHTIDRQNPQNPTTSFANGTGAVRAQFKLASMSEMNSPLWTMGVDEAAVVAGRSRDSNMTTKCIVI
jgi:hypothetical protein